MATHDDHTQVWHARDANAVLAELATSRHGLSMEEAAARLQRYGHNRLEIAPPASAWSILVAQFRSVVVLLLVAAAAIEEGRVIFDNIRKFVFYLFSCNLAEVLILLLAGLTGLPLPLLPLQILWLNLVTDTFPALALAVEPKEGNVMQRPPRDPEEAILSRPFLAQIALYAGLIAGATLGAFVIALDRGSEERAITVAFVTLALAQGLHLGNARSAGPVLTWGRIRGNPWALGALGAVVALQLAAVYVPALASILRVVPLTYADWALVLPAALIPAVVGQLLRVFHRGAPLRVA
jgi:Ca2+-transporting ATPase